MATGSFLSRGILAVGGVSIGFISRSGDCEKSFHFMQGTRHSPTQTLLENNQDQVLMGSFIGTVGTAQPCSGLARQALTPAWASLLTWEEAAPTTPSSKLWALTSN